MIFFQSYSCNNMSLLLARASLMHVSMFAPAEGAKML
jgi:hypothetical protein